LFSAAAIIAWIAPSAAAASEDNNNNDYPQATIKSESVSAHILIPFSAHVLYHTAALRGE